MTSRQTQFGIIFFSRSLFTPMPGSPRTAPARLPWPGYDSMDGLERGKEGEEGVEACAPPHFAH